MKPFSTDGESVLVRAARLVERKLLQGAAARTVGAPEHVLLTGMPPEALYARLTTHGHAPVS